MIPPPPRAILTLEQMKKFQIHTALLDPVEDLVHPCPVHTRTLEPLQDQTHAGPTSGPLDAFMLMCRLVIREIEQPLAVVRDNRRDGAGQLPALLVTDPRNPDLPPQTRVFSRRRNSLSFCAASLRGFAPFSRVIAKRGFQTSRVASDF